jgi:AraC-like DNA-binding protein
MRYADTNEAPRLRLMLSLACDGPQLKLRRKQQMMTWGSHSRARGGVMVPGQWMFREVMKKATWVCGHLLIVFLSLGHVPVCAETANTLLVNGRIATLDPSARVSEALAVRAGRILAIETSSDIRPLAGPEVAKSRVESIGEPIEEIARSTGFRDPERMRRAFVRAFGQPPQSLRRAARSA